MGPNLDIMAPGSGITSTLPSGGIGDKSGTSMASPHVAGAVALLRHRNPNLTPYDIHHLLAATAVDIGTVGRDNSHGHGRLNVFAADSILVVNPSYKAPPPAFQISSYNKTKSSAAGVQFTNDTLYTTSLIDHWKPEPWIPAVTGLSTYLAPEARFMILTIDWNTVKLPISKVLKLVTP
jgi:subtilisin family serine protease